MAPSKTTKAAPPLAHYLEKEPSAVHERNAQWIKEQIGYDADLKTIQLCISTYQQFQRSDFNKAGNEEARKAREAQRAERQKAAEERKAASQAKKDELAQKRAEKAEAAKAAKKAAPAKAPAKKAPAKAAPAKAAPAKSTATKPKPRKRTAGSTAAF